MGKNIEEFTFDDDKFNRGNFAKQITKIIHNYKNYLKDENESLVIAIDSPWGTGKTSFINMWINELKKKYSEDPKNNNLLPLKYNAWENDDWDDAFIPMLNQIFKNASFNKHLDPHTAKRATKEIIYQATNRLTGINLKEFEKIDNTKNILDEYDSYLEAKNKLKNLLKDLTKKDVITVFFIDELDRSKPLYAIETLEYIKHFFDVEDIVYVLSVDFEQLSHSIKTFYGNNMDAEGYLNRFIDFKFKIPKPNYNSYIASLLDIALKKDEKIYIDNISKYLADLSHKLNLSIRDINIITKYFNIILKTELIDYVKQPRTIYLYYYLMILKYKYRKEYELILEKGYVKDNRDTRKQSDSDKLLKNEFYNIQYIDSKFKEYNIIDFILNYIHTNRDKKIGEFNYKTIDVNDYIDEKQSNGIISDKLLKEEVDLNTLGIKENENIKDLELGQVIQRKLELFDFKRGS